MTDQLHVTFRKNLSTSLRPEQGDLFKKPAMDFQDYAYREAVTRLKFLLADSYSFTKGSAPRRSGLDSGDASDTVVVSQRPVLSEISQFMAHPSALSRYNPGLLKPVSVITELPVSQSAAKSTGGVLSDVQTPAPELLNFIEKQETYIEQLERESHYCRQELNHLLTKVKDVISENETLTDQAKTGITTSVFKSIDTSESDETDVGGKIAKTKSPRPHGSQNLLLESRISELEAKLTQSQLDRSLGITPSPNAGSTDYMSEHFKKTIDNLKQDKSSLEDTVRKLQVQMAQLKEHESSNFNRSLKNRDLAENISFEKAQSDMEIRRLKEELDRQHERVRELQQEMARRISEERAVAERRYNYQVDQLGGDLTNQWETSSKLQLDLERYRRLETDLKRELAQKASQIDELKTDIKAKTANQMSDLAQLNAEKQSQEQEMISMRLQVEKSERNNKVDSARLNAEINSLRQRLDKGDADVLQARRENLKLSDQIASLEKEVGNKTFDSEADDLQKVVIYLSRTDRLGRHWERATAQGDGSDHGEYGDETRCVQSIVHPQLIDNLIASSFSFHPANTVSTLEGMIHDQRVQMEKLVSECKGLTYKLDETTLKHK